MSPDESKRKVWELIDRIEAERTPEQIQDLFDHAVSLLGKLQEAEAHEAWRRLKSVNPFPDRSLAASVDPEIEAARARLISLWG
jgi:hypothetical protein